jgi:hypothetical protein
MINIQSFRPAKYFRHPSFVFTANTRVLVYPLGWQTNRKRKCSSNWSWIVRHYEKCRVRKKVTLRSTRRWYWMTLRGLRMKLESWVWALLPLMSFTSCKKLCAYLLKLFIDHCCQVSLNSQLLYSCCTRTFWSSVKAYCSDRGTLPVRF